MLAKTRGIVFHTVKYSETSVITKIYTQAFGLQSYIVNGVRSVGPRNKSSLFQPVNILDLEIYRRENKNLQRIKEFKIGRIFKTIPFDVFKSSTALFLVEILNKAIKEQENNEQLYAFIEDSIINLDEARTFESNFHLQFLLNLTSYLGFFPGGRYSSTCPFFDLQEGHYVADRPVHDYYLASPYSNFFDALISGETSALPSSHERTGLLEKLLLYYELHLIDFSRIKSHKILHEVLNENS